MPWSQSQALTIRLTPPEGLPGLSPAEWVEIRRTYTAGMRRRLMRESMPMALKNGAVASDGLDLFTYRQVLLEEIVVAWSDDLPVTPEALATLHPSVQDWIAGEFDRLAGEPETEEQAGEASAPSTAISQA